MMLENKMGFGPMAHELIDFKYSDMAAKSAHRYFGLGCT
jgi:hypothetical protein